MRFSSCSSVINQCLRLLSGTPWLRTMNARRLIESALKFVSYMTRNSSRCLNTKLHRLKNLLHWLHRTKPDVLHHPQHGGARSMGAGYASSCGCNIAERFGPRMGVQGGMGMGVNLRIHIQSVHFWLQHIHVFDSICVDGAISAAAAKVMRFTPHHALELKCSGDATLGGRTNLPAASVSLCISTWSAAGTGPQHSPSLHGPILSWNMFLSFSGPPSAEPIFHVSPASRCPLHGWPVSST